MTIIPRALSVSEALLRHYFPHSSERRDVFFHQSPMEEPPLSYHHQHHQQDYYGDRNYIGSGEDEIDNEEEHGQRDDKSYAHLKHVEYELRRKNPDLLDKIRFAMDDKQYGVFVKLLAQGAFWGAAMYAVPLLMIPIVTARAIGHSRLKQISRRDMGIPPRYHLRPDDTY